VCVVVDTNDVATDVGLPSKGLLPHSRARRFTVVNFDRVSTKPRVFQAGRICSCRVLVDEPEPTMATPHRKPVLSKLAGATPSLATIAKSRVTTVSGTLACHVHAV
jgi:hypothetical protein